MNGTEINHLLKLFTIFQLILFALFLITHKKGRKRSHMILGLFLLANGVWYIGNLGDTFEGFPYYRMLCRGFFFLIGPSLYFYVRSLVNPVFKLKKLHLVHGVFFIAAAAVLFIFPGYWQAVGGRVLPPEFGLIKYIHFAVYSAVALGRLKQHRTAVKNLFSTIQKKEIAWLNRLTIGFLMVYGLFFLHYMYHVNSGFPFVPPMIPIFLFFLLANLLIFNALKQPEVFSGLPEEERTPVKNSPGTKYSKTVLPEDEAVSYLEKLRSFMASEKPYLDPLLNLPQLARQLGMPAHYISQIINTRLGQNFYHFVNEYRIRESMRLLSGPPGKYQTILEVMYASGFNSKSVFNTAFKKHTGMTPGEFIKRRTS